MPFSVSNPFVRAVIGAEGSRDFTAKDVYKYTWIENTAAMTLTLTNNAQYSVDSEIIVRNSPDSAEPIVIAATGITINVSGDLGLNIPAGGIAELKKLPNGEWDLYGFIAA